MLILEKLARGMFERYSREKTGKTASWKRLSEKRKLAWMIEAFVLAEYVIQELKAKYSKNPVIVKASTSYESGFNQATHNERMKVLNFMNELVDNLKEDIVEFQDRKAVVR